VSGLGKSGVNRGFRLEEGRGDLLGDHAALLEHELSPARVGKATYAWVFRRLWFQTRSAREKSLQVLERPKARQHPAEGQGGENRQPGDDAEPSEGA
jgi:hypothetical protein